MVPLRKSNSLPGSDARKPQLKKVLKRGLFKIAYDNNFKGVLKIVAGETIGPKAPGSLSL